MSRRAIAFIGLAFALSAVVACEPGPVVSPSLSSSGVVSPSPSLSASPSPSVVPTPSAAASPAPSASATPATATATPTPAPPTPKPSTGPTSPAPSTGSGNVSATLCRKLTVAEVGTAVGVTPLTTRAEQGDANSGSCSYLAGDRAVTATSLLLKGGRHTMATLAGQGVAVSGLADAAMWVANSGTLYIRKGDAVLTIKLTPTIVPADQAKAKTVQLGKAAAPRL